MTAAELQHYAARLEATGLRMAFGERDGSGNLRRLVPMGWKAAIIHMARLAGWRVVEVEREADVIPLRREP